MYLLLINQHAIYLFLKGDMSHVTITLCFKPPLLTLYTVNVAQLIAGVESYKHNNYG